MAGIEPSKRIRKASLGVARESEGLTERFEKPKDIGFPSCRLILCLMAFWAFFVIYSLRNNLSVAVVAMVNETYQQELDSPTHTNKTTINTCPGDVKHKNKTKEGTFSWTRIQQNIVLGGFYYGYLTTQVPGGMLAQRFGGKPLLLFGIAWTSVLTMLTPIITINGGYGALLATRILEGIGEGITFPAMHFMISKWATPLERSRMVTFVYAGAQIGTVATFPISSVLSDNCGWQWVFYCFGIIGLVWSVFWYFLVYNSPAAHPRISPSERQYIEMSQGTPQTKGTYLVPWAQIVRSPAVYAVTIGHFTNNWGYYTLLNCLPQYLKDILKFDLKESGAWAGAPYLLLWAVMILSGFFADFLRKRRILSTTVVRKLFNGVGFIVPAIFLVGAGFVKCDANLTVILIIISVGTSGISWAGWSVNHLDLAPPYAGTLMGITNTAGTIPGFVGPAIVGAVTETNQTPAAWRIIFYITGGVYVFGTVFYAIFGSGTRQSWAAQQRPSQVAAIVEEEEEVIPPPAPTEAEVSTQPEALAEEHSLHGGDSQVSLAHAVHFPKV